MGRFSNSTVIYALVLSGSLALGGVAIGQDTEPDLPNDQQRQVESATVENDPLALDGLEGLEADEDLIEEVVLPEIRYDRFDTATLRALDKITGRWTDIEVEADKPIIFGSLRVTLKSCHQTPPELPPESAAFLEVDSVQATQANVASRAADEDSLDEGSERLFSGWMFASSPGLSALEHPVYDIWTIRCTTPVPVTGASGE